jgi:eukaryotic-like serine/threonine-protein kinase
VDGRADLYALGVMLFQLLSGHLPYESGSMGQLLLQVTRSAPKRLDDVCPGVPAALAELVAALLEKQPQRRPSDGMAVAAALRRIEAAWPGQFPPVSRSLPGAARAGDERVPGHNP